MKLSHELDEIKIHLPKNVKPVLIFPHAQQKKLSIEAFVALITAFNGKTEEIILGEVLSSYQKNLHSVI